jgi:type I restriction enzyme S subunit
MENLNPKLRFSEFSGNWKSKKLEEVGNVVNGLTYSPNDISDDGVLVLRSSNVKENQLAFNDNVYVNTDLFNPVFENDILICVRNGSRNLIGKNALITKEVEGVAFGAFMTVYRSELNKFIFQLFATDKYYKTIQENLGATINSINNTDLKKFEFVFPLKQEQEKIVSFLTAVDNRINQLSHKNILLEQYKKGVMQQLFSQKNRFKDDNGNNFSNWEEKKLISFKNIVHGDGDWILSKDISNDGKYKIVQLGNIGFGKYVDKDLKTISADKFIELKGTPVLKGDLLINRMVDGNLNCCIFKKDGNYITSVDVCWIRENNYFNNYFLMSVILFDENQNTLLNLSSGSGRVRISKKNLFNEFTFMLPSIEEQNKIANFLSAIDDEINHTTTQLEKTTSFKKGLLQKMFV